MTEISKVLQKRSQARSNASDDTFSGEAKSHLKDLKADTTWTQKTKTTFMSNAIFLPGLKQVYPGV